MVLNPVLVGLGMGSGLGSMPSGGARVLARVALWRAHGELLAYGGLLALWGRMCQSSQAEAPARPREVFQVNQAEAPARPREVLQVNQAVAPASREVCFR